MLLKKRFNMEFWLCISSRWVFWVNYKLAEEKIWLGAEKELLSFSIGIVPSLGALVQIFSEKGDKILIQTPVYSEFYDINEDNARVVIENRFIEKNGEYSLDLEDLENKLKEKPKLFILCNPHNPLGHVDSW